MKQLRDTLSKVLRSTHPHSEVETLIANTVTKYDIQRIIEHGSLISLPVKESSPSRLGECHAMTAYQHMLNPSIQVYSGFCLIFEDVVADQWYHHSFAVQDGYILEPTNWIRNKYFGVALDRQQTRAFVLNEVDKLLALAKWMDLDTDLIANYRHTH